MSADAYLDGLSEEAAAELKSVLRRGALGAGDRARVQEVVDGVKALLKQAYHRGFREALASAGESRSAADAPPSPAEATRPGPLAAVSWDAEDSADEEDSAEPTHEVEEEPVAKRPIMPHATVGTLRKRIVEGFALERFDIEVVVCRQGDKNRRQLKSTVRLSKYAKGAE